MPPIVNEEAFKGPYEANQPQKLIAEAKKKCQFVLDPNAKEFLPRKAAVDIENQFVQDFEDPGPAESMGQVTYQPAFVLPYQEQRAKSFKRGSFITGLSKVQRQFCLIGPKSKCKLERNYHFDDITLPSYVLPYQKKMAKSIERSGPPKLCTVQSQFCENFEDCNCKTDLNNGFPSSDEEYFTPSKALQTDQNTEEAYNPYNQTYFCVNRNDGQSLESTKHFKKIRFFSTNATFLWKLSQQYLSPGLVNSSQTLPAAKQVQPQDKACPKASRKGQGSRQRNKSGHKTKQALKLLDTSGLETFIPKQPLPWTLRQVWPQDKLGIKMLGHV